MRIFFAMTLALVGFFALTDVQAARTQTGKGGFLLDYPHVTTFEKDTVPVRLTFNDLDPAAGPVTVKLKIYAGKKVQNFKVYQDSTLIADRNTHKATTVTLTVSPDTPVTYFYVKAAESHVPFTKFKKIYLSITSMKQANVNRGVRVRKGSCTVRLANDYPYLSEPSVTACATEDGFAPTSIDILKYAVLFNGGTDSTKLSIAVTDSPFTEFGASLSINSDQKLVYDPSGWSVSDSWLQVGIMDSGTVLLKQSDGGTSAINITVCYGPKYYRHRKYDCPYGYVNYYFAGVVDTSLTYNQTPKFHSYVLQEILPDKDPWYNPWKRGEDNYLYRLGSVSDDLSGARKFTAHKKSGGKGKTTAVITTKPTMRLYNPSKVKKLAASGNYFLDSGILDPEVQLPSIPLIIGVHMKKFGKTDGKKVIYPAAVSVYGSPTIDSVIFCKRQDTGDSVVLLQGNGFASGSTAHLEYRPVGKTALTKFSLKRQYSSKPNIQLIAADGSIYYLPTKDDHANFVFVQPATLPAAAVDATLGRARYDLLIRTKSVIGGVADIFK